MMQTTPEPATRARLEQLLGRLARAYVEGLGPMETLVRGLIQGRGWDLERLASGRGPLAPVSDWALGVLVDTFAQELLATRELELGTPHSPADVDAALGELKAALA